MLAWGKRGQRGIGGWYGDEALDAGAVGCRVVHVGIKIFDFVSVRIGVGLVWVCGFDSCEICMVCVDFCNLLIHVDSIEKGGGMLSCLPALFALSGDRRDAA